ncbi:MAG: TetR/AcrR family transcriptional regulator [Alphaproteobacteria bacterium]|nr:TetR/AcrR family transcriptional regulator [Alphaproteobacteria bacterium]MBU1517167.1 TetR/AcrR family transcriptional regulator [Alphaproteobacteria bacterium]MBU2096500.1 TetR/AcrR family transcriptional regulator [Alphaproteobacteria bacterium]MBU2151652.1 TetR/AcrR family transcriptional regulator [Alphaproteobacteria bacterium]MBU2305470.1 TetR/AcrR family transcriptional regulator [Alphaproteobacteria bacterium]
MTPRTTQLSPRKAPLQARALLSIEKILAAAHVVLRRDGAVATTATSIAAEAGVAVGSLYQYFPNKEAVILALYERRLAELRAFVAETHPEGEDWRAALTGWVVAIKRRELELGFDFALFDAVYHFALLSQAASGHAQEMAGALTERLRELGSDWPDAALFDLALNAFYLNASTWLYWRAVGHYEPAAIGRLAAAVVAVVAPAMKDNRPA